MKLLRTLPALFGAGLIWGVLWAVLAILAGTVIGVIDPADIQPGEEPMVLAPIIGLVGFVCGVVFGMLLWIAEKREPTFALPLVRAAAWGILVSVAFTLVAGKGIPELLITIPLGAVSAMASVGILRKRPALLATR